MQNGVHIVTGGNAGIGIEIVKSLAQMGAHVVLVSRSDTRGQAALAQVKQANAAANVELVVGDVGSIAGTRQLADTLLAAYPAIQVLVNNAGVWPTEKVLNEDGLEQAFMVNHLAPFMLSHLLMPALKAAAPARIVQVNAGLYVKGKVDLEQTPYGGDFGRIKTYCNTKLCSVLTLKEHARRLEGSGVTVNMVHPGVLRTGLGDSQGIVGWLLRQVKRTWAPPEDGAVAPVWLATAPELATTSGVYFNEKEMMPFDDVALQPELAHKLWELSEQLAGLNQSAQDLTPGG